MQIIERGCALLGYAPIGHLAFVVLSTRVRPAATLPGGHMVRLVAESRWLQIPLQVWAAHRLQPQNCLLHLSMQSFMTAAAVTSCSIVQLKDGFVDRNAAFYTAAVLCSITRGS